MREFPFAALGTLIQGLTQVLHLKSRERDGFFQKIVLAAYGSFEATIREHHAALVPYPSRFEELAVQVEQFDNQARDTADTILSDLRGLNAERAHGQLDRYALAQTCLQYERCGYAFGGPIPRLNISEKSLLRTFMHRICEYFITNDRYQHAYGNILGSISWLEKWRAEEQMDPNQIREVKAEFEKGLDEMRTKWGDVSIAFRGLELALQHDFHFKLPVKSDRVRALPLLLRDAA